MRDVNREGVLIDVCTTNRSVWLDRGELEKLAAFMIIASAVATGTMTTTMAATTKG